VEAFHARSDRENELALSVIGITKELAEDNVLVDFLNVLEFSMEPKVEYSRMLQAPRGVD
jgi:hypothetical protein